MADKPKSHTRRASILPGGHPSSEPEQTSAVNDGAALFERVVSILEQAKGNVVRAVNSQMVLAYWLIGREIVLEIQGGSEGAAYGQQNTRRNLAFCGVA